MHRGWILGLAGTAALTGLQLQADSGTALWPNVPQYSNDAPLRETPLTEYKAYVRQIVGSYWCPSVERLSGALPAGRIHLRFTVHSDGTITDVDVLEGKENRLVSLALSSVKSPAPFKPFDESLVDQVGKSYNDDLWFTNRWQDQ